VNFCIAQDMVAVRADPTKVYPKYLLAVLRSPSVQDQIAQMHVGTLIPHFKKNDFGKLLIPVPDRHMQEFIGDIYFALSAKIDLNRRMSETLEAIARALFQSWFVNFDPVRAKSQGRDTGLPKHIADLFPDGFEESDLGEIPRGWEVGELNEVAELVNRSVKPAANPSMQWEHYSIPAFDEGRRPKMEAGAEIKSNKFRVPAGSILVSKLNPQTPRVWLPDVRDEAASICSTEFMPFMPRKSAWRPWIYLLALSPDFQNEILDRVSGSTGSRQRVSPAEIAALSILKPPDELIEAFGAATRAVLARGANLVHESIALVGTRDALLPRLISGELRITGPGTVAGIVGS